MGGSVRSNADFQKGVTIASCLQPTFNPWTHIGHIPWQVRSDLYRRSIGTSAAGRTHVYDKALGECGRGTSAAQVRPEQVEEIL
jgi:hypothetical protein